ncbi:hypothetical protein CR513_51127, partial [Mucuna pruriens]
MLPYALHRYHSSVRTSTRATPYSLVYNMEAVLPIEVEIPSLRVLAKNRLDQLNLIEEKWLTALHHRIKNAFDKKARAHIFKEGDLVIKKILPNSRDQRGKQAPNNEGPYVVKQAFSEGAIILINVDGWDLKHLVNIDSYDQEEAGTANPGSIWEELKKSDIRRN